MKQRLARPSRFQSEKRRYRVVLKVKTESFSKCGIEQNERDSRVVFKVATQAGGGLRPPPCTTFRGRQGPEFQALRGAGRGATRGLGHFEGDLIDRNQVRRTDSKACPSPPKIVIYGAPLRGIAPCGSCHGSLDNKVGSPRAGRSIGGLHEGAVAGFRLGQRRNDISQQMRNIARAMTP